MTLCKPDRAKFDEIYDKFVIGAGFFEAGDYYEIDRERYWRSLELLCQIGLDSGETVIEFGGGQMALLLTKMFGMDCTVADISEEYRASVDAFGAKFVIGNLTDDPPVAPGNTYDLVIMLEVIEHIPEPPYVSFRRLSSLLKPEGRIFLTTPNVFRLRNIARMIMGKDFLDHFIVATPGVGLGHQLEYSAEHMGWQIENAGFKVEAMIHDQLGAKGHSAKARLARTLLKPLYMRPVWKEKLVAMARRAA